MIPPGKGSSLTSVVMLCTLSKQRGDNAGIRLEEAVEQGAAVPGFAEDFAAILHVGLEDAAHCGGHRAVVNDGVGLEIIFEAAEVDVARTDAAQAVVAHYGLAVEEARAEEVDAHAGAQHFGDVAVARPAQPEAVGLLGYHQTHVHARHGCRLHGAEHGLGGHEVGCLHIDVAAGVKQYPH